MQELFLALGLSDKEAKLYQMLLADGELTAAEIAVQSGENRTNAYMILERLVNVNLVTINDSQAVRRFGAADPAVLQQDLVKKQQNLRQTQKLLTQSLPELRSLYNLGRLKPGVVHLEGLKGLEIMLNDMAQSREDALLIPGGPITGEAWETLKRGIAKRARLGVKTRALFQEDARQLIDPKLHLKQKFEVRYWGKSENPGELVVYGNKCVFTAYRPVITNTILTNDVIAATLRAVFEGLWAKAKP